VPDTSILGRAYGRGCLRELVSALLPQIGDQKDATCPLERSTAITETRPERDQTRSSVPSQGQR
jgi:hypothetical protein